MKFFKAIHISRKKVGLLALGSILAAATVLSLPPTVTAVSNIVAEKTDRKLPIYCVQTDEPKVSVSFDAA